jgi:hypothetical protein
MEVFPPFRLDGGKVGKAEAFTKELNAQLAAVAGRNWTYIDAFRDEFRSHGLCASNGGGPQETLAFPRQVNGAWTPFKPSEYRPYMPRQRWFRTPNDAFLTGHFHVAGSVVQSALRSESLSWFQLMLASTYSGAFHPTAEGHAAIADATVAAARRVLDRYSAPRRRGE